MSLGWTVLDYDLCLFYKPGVSIIAVYVDDLLIASKDAHQSRLASPLGSR
jgi:hypothetical protein